MKLPEFFPHRRQRPTRDLLGLW